MGWAGITVLPLEPGQDERDAIEAVTAARIVMTDEEPRVEPSAERAPARANSDGWLTSVLPVLRRHNPRLELLEERRDDGTGQLHEVVLHDEREPCQVVVNRSYVGLEPATYSDEDQRSGRAFGVMWQYCLVMAHELGCIAWDSDDDELIDLSLDQATAYERYRWI